MSQHIAPIKVAVWFQTRALREKLASKDGHSPMKKTPHYSLIGEIGGAATIIPGCKPHPTHSD